VRAGYGIFYARLPSASVIRLQQRNGVIQKTGTLSATNAAQLAAGPVFPFRLTGLAGAVGLTNVTYAAPNLSTPYTEQADLSIEQAVGKNGVLSASYMHSRGYKFITRSDLNLPPAVCCLTYNIANLNGTTGAFTTPYYPGRSAPGGLVGVDPRYASIVYLDNRGRLWYDGLSVSYRQRATKWASGTIAYTWSHALDNGLGGASSNIYFTDPPANVYNGNYQFEKGTSVLDQRQRLVAALIINPPSHNFGKVYANQLINGWQLSMIETAASPQHVDPLIIVTKSVGGLASSSDIVGMTTPFGAPDRVPFLPHSYVPIDSVNKLDARVSKTFTIKEKMSAVLSFEAFNVFNVISNTSVNQTAYFANGTTLAQQTGLGSGTASSGFPDGTNARRAQVSARFTF
jgi:hypothetical protein